MNKYRRRELYKISARLEDLADAIAGMTAEEIHEKMKSLNEDIYDTQSEEQDAFDYFPDNLKYSVKGEAMEDAISDMDDAIYALDEALELIEGMSGAVASDILEQLKGHLKRASSYVEDSASH